MTTAGSREINVTPLIDVLLVLLIIFLVMMPIMLRTETVDLPPHVPDAIPDGVPLTLKLGADLSVAFDDGPVFPRRELATRLRARLGKTRAVFVDFVDSVPWNQVVATVDTVRGIANDVSRAGVSVAVRLHEE
jgi:biopolymer transport protein ExbD